MYIVSLNGSIRYDDSTTNNYGEKFDDKALAELSFLKIVKKNLEFSAKYNLRDINDAKFPADFYGKKN